MTSMEDTQPNIEMITTVRPLGKNSGLLSQINDPLSQELNIETVLVKLSANFGKLTTYLGQICEHLPIPDARENCYLLTQIPKAENSTTVCPLQTLRKIPSWTRHKSWKDDVEAVSLTTSEEEVNERLWISSKPRAATDSQMEVNDELLTELSAGLIDNKKKGP